MSFWQAFGTAGKFYFKGAMITIPFCAYDIYQNRHPHPSPEDYILERFVFGLAVCFWPIYWIHKFGLVNSLGIIIGL